MASEKTELAILFADVVGSTRLFEVLGDVEAREKVSSCLSMLIATVESHGGTLIKTIGDEIMCTFAEPDMAFQSACAMQDSIAETVHANRDGNPLLIRVGFHYGSALMEAGDIFGDAVNVAARVVALTKPEQIMTTKQLVDRVSPMLAHSTRFVEQCAVKGRRDELEIFEVLWGDSGDDATAMVSGLFPAQEQGALMRLRYKQVDVTVSKLNPSAVFGRGLKNDIVVPSSKASRLHAKVDYRPGRFVLVDQSTNGTFVKTEGAGQVFVRRDEYVLPESGSIILGGDVDAVIEFDSEN